MRYALYARKSSEDSSKQVQSIENQIDVLKTKAKREGLKIAKVYQESKSAKIPYKRVQFQQMIADIEEGKIDAVICWKLDRLSRNPIDGGIIHHYLLQSKIKEIVTYEKTYYPCDNSIMMSVELGMATEYSQALSKNVKRGHDFKIKKGSYPNKAPLGYINTVDRLKGEREVIPDPERYDLVRKLWNILLTENIAYPQILKRSHEMGLRLPATRSKPEAKLSINGLYKLFRNPFYYGEFKWGGEIHQGNHQAMITKEEFEKAQDIISGRVRPLKTKHNFAFTGLIKCGECGASITAENKYKKRKDGTVNHSVYYRCTHNKAHIDCKQPGIRDKDLESQFVDVLDGLTVADEYIDWAKDYLKNENLEAGTKEDAIKTQQRKQIDKIDNQVQDLLSMKLEGLIDTDIFKAKKDALIEEKQQILDNMKLDAMSQSYRIDKTIEVLEFSKMAKTLFEKSKVDDKKLILSLIGSPLTLKDKKLDIELKGAFKHIYEANRSGLAKNKMFATLNTHSSSENSPEEQALIFYGGGGGELPPSSEKASLGSTTSLFTGSKLLPCLRSVTINGFLSLNLYLLAKLNEILEDALTKCCALLK